MSPRWIASAVNPVVLQAYAYACPPTWRIATVTKEIRPEVTSLQRVYIIWDQTKCNPPLRAHFCRLGATQSTVQTHFCQLGALQSTMQLTSAGWEPCKALCNLLQLQISSLNVTYSISYSISTQVVISCMFHSI